MRCTMFATSSPRPSSASITTETPRWRNARPSSPRTSSRSTVAWRTCSCSQGQSQTNNHATYLVTSTGGLALQYQSGAEYEESIYDILEAKRVGPDKLSLRQVLTSNDRVALDIVLLKENDKIRIWSSLFPDGTALVEDGVMTSMTGRETRWMTRCP